VFAIRVLPGGPTAAPDAPPASDNAPATPNTVTAFVRPFRFEFRLPCDMVEASHSPPPSQPGAGTLTQRHSALLIGTAAKRVESVWPDFGEIQLIGGAPAQNRQHVALLDGPGILRRNLRPCANQARPTLGELQRTTPWVWLWCERCQHHAPLACAVPVILWGPDASSDKLRAGARCTSCGGERCDPPASRVGGQSYRLLSVSDRQRRLDAPR
jgi:hypothetical protein